MFFLLCARCTSNAICVSLCYLSSEKSIEQPEEVLDFSAVFVIHVHL